MKRLLIPAIVLLTSIFGVGSLNVGTASAATNTCQKWTSTVYNSGNVYCSYGSATYFAAEVACQQVGGSATYWQTSAWKRAGSGQTASVRCISGFRPVQITPRFSAY